jgi:hypothetical protein
MTRPSEVKVREGATPGTRYDAFEVGATLPEVSFTITPEIIDEYITAVEGREALYVVGGRKAAPPDVLCVYMTSALYRKYPPIQGIIMCEVAFGYRHPIWRDESTEVRLSGEITGKFVKKERKFLQWKGRYRRADGTLLAKVENTFSVPE